MHGARNTTCSGRQLCVHWKIVVIHGRGHDELHREMGTNGEVREENAMAWHQCARTHDFQHPKTSSKATYRSGCGVSSMEMILLVTLSSISPTYMRYAKMFFVPLYALGSCYRSPLHGGKKQITQPHCMGLNLRKEIRGPQERGETPELSISFILLCLHFQK